jgi:Fur family transcriptional regulator, ferric uptake regulator
MDDAGPPGGDAVGSPRSKVALRLEWRRFLAERGLKPSEPRNAVLEAFFDARGHVSLAEIHALARVRHPNVGLATVYRTMRLVEEAGLAGRHEFQGGGSRYETTVGRAHHDHLICQYCSAIAEFESPEIEQLQEQIAADRGFTLHGHRHEIYGICAACQRELAARASQEVPPQREPS